MPLRVGVCDWVWAGEAERNCHCAVELGGAGGRQWQDRGHQDGCPGTVHLPAALRAGSSDS